ncbi:MAG: flagellar export protein FliJ [Anaerolineales bacterium]|nr:flagellar export protein FliJ [Anaerolineales bacterium]
MRDTNTFRLQSILDLKTNVVDNLETEFAHLRQAHQREETKLEALHNSRTQEIEALHRQQQNGPLDCDAIQVHQQYLQALADQAVRQAVRVREAARQADAKREELVKTMQDQKTLEKLRERHDTKQYQILLRREAGIIDDLVTTRYARER